MARNPVNTSCWGSNGGQAPLVYWWKLTPPIVQRDRLKDSGLPSPANPSCEY